MKRVLKRRAAFSLIEVTLALGVAGFCLLAVFGLLPIGVQTNQRALSQTAATAILSSVVADMRATPKTSPTTAQYAITFGAAKTLYFDSAGQFSTLIGTNSRYRLNITFPNGALAYPATYADLTVTWPAAVDPLTTTPGGSSEIFAAFDRHP